MVITEEKILSNIDKVQKLINPNSKKQIVQLEDDSYFKDLVESIKTYLLEYPKKKTFPRAVYKASYDLVEYATNQFEDNTRRIELLIRKREKNIKLGSVLRDATAAVKAHAKNWKEIVKKLATKYPADVAQSLAVIGNSTDTNSKEYLDACELIDAKIRNLEQNLHIEIDMERIEDRSKALSFIGIEIAEALKFIPAPADGFVTSGNTFEEQVEPEVEEIEEPVQAVEPKVIVVPTEPVAPQAIVPEPVLEPAAVAAAPLVPEAIPVEASNIIKEPVNTIVHADPLQVNPVFVGLFDNAEPKAQADSINTAPAQNDVPVINDAPVSAPVTPVQAPVAPVQAPVKPVAQEPVKANAVPEVKVAFAPETKQEPVQKAEPIQKVEPVQEVVQKVESVQEVKEQVIEQPIQEQQEQVQQAVEVEELDESSSLIDSMIRDADLNSGIDEDKIIESQIEEQTVYNHATRFETKPSFFERIKNSKFVRTVKFVLGIRIKLEYPALPEGRG
jgi:hypothetical protein